MDAFKEYERQIRLVAQKNKKLNELLEDIEFGKETSTLEKYLNFWIIVKNGFYEIEIDKIWLESDEYKNKKRIKADTIFSVWQPLKKYIELTTGTKYIKSIENLKEIKEKIKKREIVIENYFKKFVDAAATIGNVMEYPYEARKVSFQKRGMQSVYSDLILISLYNCFKDGKYNRLFSDKANYSSPEEWIESQHLKMFFKGKISKENIINIGAQTVDDNSWSRFEKTQFKEIIEKYTEIINERTKELKK